MPAKVDILLKNISETVGEGPHWDSRTNTLLHVDVKNGTLRRWNSETNESDSVQFDGSTGFVVPCEKPNSYVIGLQRSLVHYDWNSKETVTLATVDDDKPDRVFNDGKCDVAGRLFAGTMAMPKSGLMPPELEMGTLYCLQPDKSIGRRVENVETSNGMDWTSDSRTMFYIDSKPRKVFAFDYDLSTGAMSNQRTVVDFGDEGTIPTMGYPDGMTIDTEGKIWVACFGASKVIRFDPETGAELLTVDLPLTKITSCCFGGKNLDELYVTTSRYTLSEGGVPAPLDGSLLRVSGLGFKGRPGNSYGGIV